MALSTETTTTSLLSGEAAAAYVGLLMSSSQRGFRVNIAKIVSDARSANFSLVALNRLRRAARSSATHTLGRIVAWRHRPARAAAASSRRRKKTASHANLSVARPRPQEGH